MGIVLKRLRRLCRIRLGKTASDLICNTGGFLLGIGILLTLPVTVPIAIMLLKIEDRHRRKDAQHLACVRCGSILGTPALALADAHWEMYVRSQQPDQDDIVRWRLRPRTLFAICPQCQAAYNYQPNMRAFIPLSDLEWASYQTMDSDREPT
jgi:hypothetical protein